MAKKVKPTKPTIVRVTIGVTKNIGNYEFLRVDNCLEATVLEGQNVADVQEELRKACIKLNERDFNSILQKSA